MNERQTIFYDGECALCHGFVNFVLKYDAKGQFQFAPLQGESAKAMLSEELRASLPESVVLFSPPDNTKVKSTAVIEVLAALPGWGALAGVMRIFPRVLRDVVYDFVAKVRRKIFGTKNQLCPLIPDGLRDRILL